MSDVTVSGPMFDGQAEIALREGTRAVRHKLADEGERLATAVFLSMIRENHGVFLSTITETDSDRIYVWGGDEGRKTYTMPITDDDPSTETIVTTELSTYGPWLEGTGSRNETTRFKGYHGYRIAAQQLDGMAGGIAERELAPYVARCNE